MDTTKIEYYFLPKKEGEESAASLWTPQKLKASTDEEAVEEALAEVRKSGHGKLCKVIAEF